jgi:DNA-binding transcriptional LysR family regulator
VLTDGGRDLVPHAERVESAASALTNASDAQSRDLSGTVRLTTEEIFAMTLLAPLLTQLHELHPAIRIELDTSTGLRDLGAGEADVALRSTSKPQGPGVVGRRICQDDWTLYCSRDYAARHGLPRSVEELKSHAIVAGGAGGLWRAYSNWIRKLGLEDQVAMQHGSSTGLLTAVRSGFGIAALPCLVADSDPDLIQCLPPPTDHQRVMWLVTHERVRHTPRVRVVIDFLYERLSAHVRQLEARKAA